MRIRLPASITPRLPSLLTVGVCVSALTLAAFGYNSNREWQRSARLLADRRADQAADLFLTALTRDMRGVQYSVLPSVAWNELVAESPGEMNYLVASAFARFPYPESFFAWRGTPTPESVTFFNRADRRPRWMPPSGEPTRFPVVVGSVPTLARRIVDRVLTDASLARRYSTFDLDIDGASYQAIACLLYRDEYQERPDAVFGFLVNLDWARRQYFPDITQQVASILGPDVRLTIREAGARQRAARDSRPAADRVLPLMFFDPVLVGAERPHDLSPVAFVAEAAVDNDPMLQTASESARRTIVIAAFALLLLIVGLVLSAKAVRAQSTLAAMRSDFVSTVTHELKTPIASIRVLAETLFAGRVSDRRSSQEYAQMVIQEAKRLTRLVDNLLAYARISDVAEIYAFEPASLRAVVDSSLKEYRYRLQEATFDVQIDVPGDLPFVRVDKTAIGLVLDNLLDNAIRYSRDTSFLSLTARAEGDRIVLQVADKGLGIPAGEIAQVTRKFVRGRHAGISGSGLGLAIADRIVHDHGGSLSIHSILGVGTTVTVALPRAEFA